MDDTGDPIRRYHRFWQARTIRNGLVLVVLAALLPMAVLSLLQGAAAWQDSRVLVANQLRANAWAIAEGERDAFVIARYALLMASRNRDVRDIGPGCTEGLAQGQQIAIGVINFARSDAAGRVRCSVLPFNAGESFADAPWWQRGIKTEGFSLSKPTIGSISKRSILVMMLTVRKPDGAQDGAITAAISLDALQASLNRRRATNPAALIEIIGSDGAVILSNSAVVFSKPDLPLRAVNLTPLKSQDGAEWMYATTPLQGKDLFVLYAEPHRDLMSGALWQVRQSLILPVIAMSLATLAIWLGSYWLVGRWLTKLQSLTTRFGQGDFTGDRSAYVTAPREISALSNDLHIMGDMIGARDAALVSALAAKSALTNEVHHRVKNNLQIVTSLLTLQADRVADASAREVLGQARSRIAALGLIHRLLYQHGEDNERSGVNMRQLLAELGPQLRAANRRRGDVSLNCMCKDFELSVDDAVPLTLFIVEGVSNAFRHGFDEGVVGCIDLQLVADEEQVELTVKDDGDGYVVADTVAKMGIELMNAFAGQLNGAMQVTSNRTGTQVTLRYPLARDGSADRADAT